MHGISRSLISNWSKSGHDDLPSTVDCSCPFCGRLVTFTLSSWNADSATRVKLAASFCPGCRKKATFLWMPNDPSIKHAEKSNHKLFIGPNPSFSRGPVSGLDEAGKMPERLKAAYVAAISTYNARQWPAAAVMCGRVLEGITKDLLPQEKGNLPLAQQLKQLPEFIKLDEPIKQLADAIRKGRNVAAHFDAEKEPDEEVTTLMVDLLDYIIEYLYVLPGRISILHDKLAK